MSKDIPLKHFTPQKIDFIDEDFFFGEGGLMVKKLKKCPDSGNFNFV